MTNLLAIPSLWTAYDDSNPPDYWDGTKYHRFYEESSAEGQFFQLTYGGSPGDGDVFSGTLSMIQGILHDQPPYSDACYVNLISESGDLLDSAGPASIASPLDFSFAAAAGASIILCLAPTDVEPSANYDGTTDILPVANTATNYNCDCDDDFPTATLLQLRTRMAIRMGWAGMVTPPGAAALLNDFLQSAQTLLYRKYSCFRTRRWFTWNMPAGQRFYDFNDNADVCLKKLDPRKVVWVGVSKGDDVWQELICGINPLFYSSKFLAIPQYYEFRQCIEVWPAPNDDLWLLRIKGDFGLLPFEDDADVTTIDAEAVFLFALANCKSHYGQADAGQVMSTATGLIADYVAGSHFTRRYVPGSVALPNAIPPKMVP